MRKFLVKLMFALMVVALLPVQVAQACSAFIVGKDLTTDGSMLFGRTETILMPLMADATTKPMK